MPGSTFITDRDGETLLPKSLRVFGDGFQLAGSISSSSEMAFLRNGLKYDTNGISLSCTSRDSAHRMSIEYVKRDDVPALTMMDSSTSEMSAFVSKVMSTWMSCT